MFVGDDTKDRIIAADYNGKVLDSVSGIEGIFDLALSDDRTTLYATARSSHEIVAIDTATLDIKARYPVATGIGPLYVEFTGGKAWFTYENPADGHADLGSIDPAADPADGAAPTTLGQLPRDSGVGGGAFLDTDSSSPGLLAIGATDFHDTAKDLMAVLDVSGATPQVAAWHDGGHPLRYVSDIDLVPGTPQVLVDGTDRHGYADGTFTACFAYPAGERADIAPTGLIAQISGANVAVFRPGQSLSRSARTPTPRPSPGPRTPPGSSRW